MESAITHEYLAFQKKRLLIGTNANGDHRSRRISETSSELRKTYRANSSSCASNLTKLPNQLIKGRIQQGCRHEMPIKSVKGSLKKAGKQEDLTELMMDRISKGERLS